MVKEEDSNFMVHLTIEEKVLFII